MSTPYIQPEINNLKRVLPEKITQLLTTKKMLEFKYRNFWQANDALIITLDFIPNGANRNIYIEFTLDLPILFNGNPGDCDYLDRNADISNKALDRVDRALLRILYTIFISCSNIVSPTGVINEWRTNVAVTSITFQYRDRHGTIRFDTRTV